MKKIITVLALVASTYTFAAPTDLWGMGDWSDYCSEWYGEEVLTQDEVNYINANMMWSDNDEFHAINK